MPQFSAPTKFWIIVSQSIPSGFTLILNRGIIGPDTNLATGFRISRALSQFQGSANVHRVERGESCTMAPSWGVGDFFGVSNAISRTPVSLIFKFYSTRVRTRVWTRCATGNPRGSPPVIQEDFRYATVGRRLPPQPAVCHVGRLPSCLCYLYWVLQTGSFCRPVVVHCKSRKKGLTENPNKHK